MADILKWISVHDTVLWWLGILSVVTFAGTLIVIPVLVVRIPTDYFTLKKRNPRRLYNQHSVLGVLSFIVKNLFGIVFVLAGLAMLLLPGQGLITILIGIMLIDFPGKRALERCVVQQPSVLRSINWMRAKAGRQPLEVPQRTAPFYDRKKRG